MTHLVPIIKDVKARAVDAPLARPITTSVATIPSAPLVLIDVLTDQDVTGRAYIFCYLPTTLRPLVGLLKNFREMLVGKTVSPIDRMRDCYAAFHLLGRQGLLGMAIAGLDMALWDALARAQGLSVVRLLGGHESLVSAYDSYGIIDPRRDAARLESSLEQGFSAIKFKIGGGSLRQDLETVRAVREIIGEDVHLMVDYNQSLSVPEAIRRIGRLAEFDLHWVEEPVAAEDLSGHARVRQKSPVPIQAGENWWFPEALALAIAARASDHAMFDIMKIGGITGWLRAAGQADGASLPVSSHLFVEASTHVMAVTPSAHLLEHLDVAGAVLREPLTIEGGALRPRGPGLGIDWDEDAIRRYAL